MQSVLVMVGRGLSVWLVLLTVTALAGHYQLPLHGDDMALAGWLLMPAISFTFAWSARLPSK